MGASHAPCYINVTKHGNFPLSDGTFGTALCATGTPPRGHGTALALLERPEGAMEQRLRYWNAPEGLTLCAKLAFQRS